jgi:EAL domain-containing protein (putative c-di-GMP-specific phosphodiesterase class I)
MVRAIVEMARSLRLEVIAEGVETDDQLEQLRRLRCHKVQGYLFSRPVPATQVLGYIHALSAAAPDPVTVEVGFSSAL